MNDDRSVPRADESHRATAELAGWAAGLRFEDLPGDVVHQAKRVIIDTLACVLGAWSQVGAHILSDTLLEMGGAPEATALPSGTRTSAATAAFVNAQLANVLDLDDNFLSHAHFANSAVAAPLACAEWRGSSGRDLLLATTLAFEVDARLSLAMSGVAATTGEWPDVQVEWAETAGQGSATIGAAVGCSRLAGAGAPTIRHAMGIAGYGAPVPTLSKFSACDDITMYKYAPYGQIAWTGVVASRLAGKGLTADPDVLDGSRGFWRMAGSPECDWDLLLGELSSTWWINETSFKMFPTCGWNRYPIQAARRLVREEGIRPEEIEQVTIGMHPLATKPLWVKTDPANYLETQMSVPYAVALAILDVDAPRWQAAETIADPDVAELTAKTRVVVETEAVRAFAEQTHVTQRVRKVRRSPSRVTIEARGTQFSAIEEYADGDPFVPKTSVDDQRLRSKFLDFGGLAVPKHRLEQAFDDLMRLEELEDVGSTVDLLSATAAPAGPHDEDRHR